MNQTMQTNEKKSTYLHSVDSNGMISTLIMHRFNIIIIITKCTFVIVGATASQRTFQGTNDMVKDYGSLIAKYEEMICVKRS